MVKNAIFLSKRPIILCVSGSRYACNQHAVVEDIKSLYFLLKQHSRLQTHRRHVEKLSGETSHITTYDIYTCMINDIEPPFYYHVCHLCVGYGDFYTHM